MNALIAYIQIHAAASAERLGQRVRDEEGQGGVEYGGVIIAAGLLVIAIIGAATGLGEQIVSGIGDIISDVMGSR